MVSGGRWLVTYKDKEKQRVQCWADSMENALIWAKSIKEDLKIKKVHILNIKH